MPQVYGAALPPGFARAAMSDDESQDEADEASIAELARATGQSRLLRCLVLTDSYFNSHAIVQA